MSVTYQIKGLDGVHKMLRAYTNPEFTKRMKSAVKAGGNELKGPLRAESRTVSKRMGRAVTVVQSPRGLAGKLSNTRDPHVYVGYRKKTAFFAHFVVGGTQDHGPRKAKLMAFWDQRNSDIVLARRVHGVKANPIPSRVADRHEGAAYRAIDHDLDKTEPR